jgi:hypothetical protein
MADVEAGESKAHEQAESAVFEAEEKKSPKTIAEDYMIPMSDSALEAWKDKPGFAEYCAQVATGLYPSLEKRLAMGITTKALLDPYVEMAKKVLGPFVKANWDDPMWQKVLSGGTDPKTNSPTVMPLKDFLDFIKSDPTSGFEHTPEAMQNVGRAIGQAQNNEHAWDGTPEHKGHLMQKIAGGDMPGGIDPSALQGAEQ